MYFSAAHMPSVAAVRVAMRRAVDKFPRFTSVVVETAALDDTCWRSVDVDLTRHVVQHAAVDAHAQSARIDALLNADLPRDQPLWRIDLLPQGK